MKLGRLRRGDTSRLSSFPMILLMSGVCTGLMFVAYPAIDPATGWNDHYFYWGQANEWFNLGQTLVLTPDTQALLDQYRIDYYYDAVNGSSQQPPYVYRVAVPFLAGLLGLTGPLWIVFMSITVASFLTLGLSVALGVRTLTHSTILTLVSIPLAITPAGFGVYTRFYAMVDLPSIALVAWVIALTIRKYYVSALLLSAILAPLIKETTIGLASFVALVMWIRGNTGWLKWVAAITPVFLLLAIRLVTPVPSPPLLSELYVQASPYQGVITLADTFGFAWPLAIGLLAVPIRLYFLATIPLFISLLVITSSVVTAADRIWLTLWPFLVIFGLSGLKGLFTRRSALLAYVAVSASGLLLSNLVVLGHINRIALTIWLALTLLVFGLMTAYRTRDHQKALMPGL